MLFEYLGDILVKKKGNLPLNDYYPFLINRWLSFAAPSICTALNDTVNKIVIDKEYHYKLLLTIFPKLKHLPRMDYIKKVKKEDKEDTSSQLASGLELSRREVTRLLEFKKSLV
jgi:hypothetical protein